MITPVKPVRFQEQQSQLIKKEILRDLEKHLITAKKVDGLYCHWRCQEPGTWNRGFDIITWPGSLCYTGDMGDFLFRRTDDMVGFMRRAAMSYSYAAEKCVAFGSPIREWRQEVFEELLAERLQDAMDEDEPNDAVSRKIELIRNAVGDEDCEHTANEAIYESGLWDGSDFPSCTAFTGRFLWCLHAIKWFCDKVK